MTFARLALISLIISIATSTGFAFASGAPASGITVTQGKGYSVETNTGKKGGFLWRTSDGKKTGWAETHKQAETNAQEAAKLTKKEKKALKKAERLEKKAAKKAKKGKGLMADEDELMAEGRSGNRIPTDPTPLH